MEDVQFFNHILDTFKINAKCIQFKQINTYNYYDILLLNKTKVKDITKYIDEISLKLRVSSRPTVKVLHSEGVVRLEYTSNNNENINLFDLFADGDKPPNGNLKCLLGQSVNGNKIWMNLEDNPNLIISGTTGSGKSVLLHNIIANLLFFNKCKMYLIDPKNIEFSYYSNMKNIEVCNSYDEAIFIIDNLNILMEKRFELLKNKLSFDALPPVVLIIDEFADLILQDTTDLLYKKILKLSQKCRAAKIHIIISTQRPSTNIINGAIKANFPARISCKVASSIDSRIILDSLGAENLQGKGDSLLKDNLRSLERFQVAFVDPLKTTDYFSNNSLVL